MMIIQLAQNRSTHRPKHPDIETDALRAKPGYQCTTRHIDQHFLTLEPGKRIMHRRTAELQSRCDLTLHYFFTGAQNHLINHERQRTIRIIPRRLLRPLLDADICLHCLFPFRYSLFHYKRKCIQTPPQIMLPEAAACAPTSPSSPHTDRWPPPASTRTRGRHPAHTAKT